MHFNILRQSGRSVYAYFKIYFYMPNFASIGRVDLVMAYFITIIYIPILDTLIFKLWIILTIINNIFDLFIACVAAPINCHTYLNIRLKCKPSLYLIVFKGLNPCNELELVLQTIHRFHNQFSRSQRRP